MRYARTPTPCARTRPKPHLVPTRLSTHHRRRSWAQLHVERCPTYWWLT
nr:hypothetical protein [Kibdelosporangium sp. MJ126-NF4]